MEKGHTFTQSLSEILQRYKVVSKEEALAMEKAFEESEKSQFDEFLLDEGLVAENDLLRALAEHYQMPSFDVVGYFFDHNLLTKFPKGFLLRQAIVPVEVEDNILSVVASNPDEEGLESSIREFVSYDVVFMVGLKRDICDAVKEFYDRAPTEIDEDQDLREERQLEVEAEIIEDSGEPVIKDIDDQEV